MRTACYALAILTLSSPSFAQVEVNWDVLDGAAPQVASQQPTYKTAAVSVPTKNVQAQPSSVYVVPEMEPEPKAPVAESASALDDKFLGADWSGRANAGFTAQSGNSDTEELTLDAQTTAKWGDVHRAKVKAEYEREKDNNTETVNNQSLEGLYDYFFKPEWFLETNLKWEQDDIAGLDHRINAGLGLGYQPFDTDEFKLKMVLSPTYVDEEYETGDGNSSSALRWALDAEKTIWDGSVTLFHNHEILAPTDEMSEYNLETETGARVPIHKGLIATAQIDHDVDKAAPAGTSENDTKYALKLGYEW